MSDSPTLESIAVWLEHVRRFSDDREIETAASSCQTRLAVLLSDKELSGDRKVVLQGLVERLDFLTKKYGMTPHNVETLLEERAIILQIPADLVDAP